MRIRVLCLLALLLSLLSHMQSARAAETATKPAQPMLFAAYYVWYHSASHPADPWMHWTRKESQNNALALKERREGEPPLSGAARPLAGFYDSADANVALWHVKLAQSAGIDAFLVDWWDNVKQQDAAIEKGILFAAEKLNFKIALLDERAQFHHKRDDYQASLARALKKYKDSPAYLKIDGRPVVYLYQVATKPGLSVEDFAAVKAHVESQAGPVYWIVDKIAHDARALKERGEDYMKCIPADWLASKGVDSFGFYSTFSNFRAHQYDQLAGKYRYMTKLAHDAGKKMLLPVHPGHDNSRFNDEGYVMPRRDGQTLRDYLRAATDAGADYIMVTSWNEWPETTVVEPSSSWADPYLYLKVLAEWKGRSFTAPPLPDAAERKAPASVPAK